MSLVALAVLSSMHFEGDVTAAGGDYVDVPFPVPAGTVECQITHSDGSDLVILDWGVWQPDGTNRGWSGGLTDDIIIGVDQSTRGYQPGPIAPGMWTLVIGKAQLSSTGGHYTADITCRDNATLTPLPRAAYTPIVMSPDRRWYKGDMHVHSTESGDASATIQADVDLAHSRGLDFFNLSDHNTVSQHALVAAQQPSWPVLVLRSSEITTYSGHTNGIGIHDYVDHRLGYDSRTMADVFDDVVAQGGIISINHPATNLGTNCIGCGWMHPDDVPWNEVSAIELLTAGWTIGERVFTPTVVAMWDTLEDEGHRISAVGGSDDHTAGVGDMNATGAPVGSPCTLVHADNLSEAAIIDAIKHQHTLVQLRGPDDPLVDMTMKSADGDAEIGDDVTGVATAKITVHVTTGSGTFAQIWRDGEMLVQNAVDSDDFTWSYEDAIAGDHRYRAELVNDTNNRLVITSHIYAAGLTGSSGGSGCSAGGGAGLLPVLALLFLRRRRT
jgi:uncharacterized protein (TIGR03382 family)